MQNFTIRATLWDYYKSKAETYPIKIAVTINKKVTYVTTGYKVRKNQWNKAKSAVIAHENANLINVSIRRKIADLEAEMVKNSLNGVELSKRVIRGEVANVRAFIPYASEVRYHSTHINRLRKFAGDSFLLSDVNVEFLRKFEAFEKSRGMAKNTLATTFKYIHKMVNQAYKEGLIPENPFSKFTAPKTIQTDRTYLTEKELSHFLKHLDELPDALYHTATWFLFGCYTGLRNQDWITFDINERVEDGFLKVRPQKTTNSTGRWVVLPIGKTLNKILERVKKLPKCYTNQECNRSLKLVGVHMGFKKILTTHCARHSFGYMCAANGIPESTTAALMGISADVVKVYYHLSGENIIKQAAILKSL